uniref:Uncharacterized protein n=1 Tax=Glossina pallidipes TaxID=7398 RepID=A0A1A9ZUH4_GLOPL
MNTLRPTNDLFLYFTIIWNARSRRSVVLNNNAYVFVYFYSYVCVLTFIELKVILRSNYEINFCDDILSNADIKLLPFLICIAFCSLSSCSFLHSTAASLEASVECNSEL